MLRALVIVVLLANVLFWVWTRGGMAPALPPPHSGEREPERLAAQLNPERLVLLPTKAASAAITAITAARAAAIACVEAGPLGEADIAAAETALAAVRLPEGSVLREAASLPPLWWVYAARVTDAGVMSARTQELARLRIDYEVVDQPTDLAGGLRLSRHATRAEAEAALAAVVVNPPLRFLRVVGLPTPPARLWLRVPKADAEQQDKLLALPSAPLAGGFKACASR